MSLWLKSYRVTIQIKIIEQYLPVVLFIMRYKVALASESVNENYKADDSKESY